jgi:hypothetical protein
MKIEDYEFSDTIAELKCTNSSDEQITIKSEQTPWHFINKQDVIAMAKHFKITAGELNEG